MITQADFGVATVISVAICEGGMDVIVPAF